LAWAEPEPELVIRDLYARAFQALYTGRVSESARYINDLMIYMSVKNMDKEFLELFKVFLREVEKQPERICASFTKSLDNSLMKVTSGTLAAVVGELASNVEKLKIERLERYITPPKEYMDRAEKILKKVLMK